MNTAQLGLAPQAETIEFLEIMEPLPLQIIELEMIAGGHATVNTI